MTTLDVLHTTRGKHQGFFAGKPYNLIVWRRCKCRGCGTVQMVKLFLNE